MHFSLLLLLLNFYLIEATPHQKQSPFLKFNLENFHKDRAKLYCQNAEFYFEEADKEESNPANQDKIILYHGESYGSWIFQMILKKLMYPEAPEDWLPLRFEALNTEIDKTHLLRLIINTEKFDHHQEFRKIGLSVSPNLYSKSPGESAWGVICKGQTFKWNKLSGFSDLLYATLHHHLYSRLREKFIPEQQWPIFKMQKKLLNYFIQEKRLLKKNIKIENYNEKVQEFFPKTFDEYRNHFDLENEQTDDEKLNYDKKEAVALQIIMEKELVDKIVYNAHPLGWLKDDKEFSEYDLWFGGKVWKGEKVEPYSEVYKQVKNQKDDEQARLALTNDFRRSPSSVKIKAIAGIMKNEVDYKIIKSMINEMVEFRKHLNSEGH